MRTLRVCVLGVYLFMLAGAVTPADAQTVAAGPYYAVPSWDQTIVCASPASCPRFIVLSNMGNNAVLDRETGLVWEQATSNIPGSLLTTNWQGALDYCRDRTTGNRYGWRLPTVQDFGTLFDPTTKNLPPGHPFNLLTAFYWTATEYRAIPTQAWAIRPGGFGASIFVPGEKNNAIPSVWCVRGGQSLESQ
jgi:hypothetical protein